MDRKNISTVQLARWLKVSDSRIRQKFNKDVWDSLAELKAIAKETGYSLDSIITGEGFEDVSMVQEPSVNYLTIKRIPFYDIEATGGTNGSDVSAVMEPTGSIDIGDILRDSEAAIRMAGNSMMPGYPPGSVLGLIPKKNTSIIPGEVYVYEDEDGRHCKRLFYKDDDPQSDTYICYSDTTTKFDSGPRIGKLFYPPYELKIANIVRIFSVVGVIKRNSTGPVNYKYTPQAK